MCRSEGASSSQSASQTHEMSRPSAVLSFSTPNRSSCSPSSASVRSTSLAPAGFLTSRIDVGRPPRSSVSARPNAGATARSPAAIASSGAPRARQSAAAPSAL